VLDKAFSSKDSKFLSLYNGENLKGDKSSSDMALLCRLGFWCGGDIEQMIRIFNTSGLARDESNKAHYDEYLRASAEKAVSFCTSFYGQNDNKPATSKKPTNAKNGDGKDGK
jgi:putative DNA primase/helicase